MGKYNMGILGGFRGKVGTVVGTYWRGRPVIKALPKKSNKPPTPAQLAVRQRFAFTARFLRLIMPVIQQTFAEAAGKQKSAYNAAFAYNLKEAALYSQISHSGTFNWNKVKVSDGTYPNVTADSSVSASLTLWRNLNKKAVVVAWMAADWESERGADLVCVVVYNVATQEARFSFGETPHSSANAGVNVPTEWQRKDLHVWVFTADKNLTKYSNSYHFSNLREMSVF